VLYAVLLALATIAVWERFSDAELDVVHEAGAAENIYRLSQGLNDKARVAVLGSVANYLKAAINDDWPAMDRGTARLAAHSSVLVDDRRQVKCDCDKYGVTLADVLPLWA
jgi:hypothetical protein